MKRRDFFRRLGATSAAAVAVSAPHNTAKAKPYISERRRRRDELAVDHPKWSCPLPDEPEYDGDFIVDPYAKAITLLAPRSFIDVHRYVQDMFDMAEFMVFEVPTMRVTDSLFRLIAGWRIVNPQYIRNANVQTAKTTYRVVHVLGSFETDLRYSVDGATPVSTGTKGAQQFVVEGSEVKLWTDSPSPSWFQVTFTKETYSPLIAALNWFPMTWWMEGLHDVQELEFEKLLGHGVARREIDRHRAYVRQLPVMSIRGGDDV